MAQQPTQQDLLSVLRKSAVIIQKQEQALAAYHEPLAIVGMGCRYPGAADTPTQFWQNLLAGLDSVGFLSDPRAKDLYGGSTDALRAAVRSADEAKMAAYALRGGFLERVDEFDPAFFGLSPREVLVMDPAHRLLLETTWQALEDANLVPATLFNTEVGVFIGNGLSGYAQFCEGEEDNLYTATGNTPSTAAGRISYLLGLTGPCISLDTACSSSLTAIHLACQSLRTGECNTALAGGVNVILEANSTSLFANGNMLSGEARCKSFDAAADG
ncbi:MAG: polyketide synthase, partial [Caldilinea sp.]